MADASFSQSSFLGGEWSKTMQGRFDRTDYRTAMNVCLNAIPLDTGAWTRRPGTMQAGTTRGGLPGRVMSFAFQENNPYTLELTGGHARFFNGANLVTTNDSQVVTSISTANPALVTLPATATWATGDQVFFSRVTVATPLLLNRLFIWTSVSGTTGTLTDAITGATIDGSTLGTPGAGVMINRVLDLPSPFIGSDWSSVRGVQAETDMLLLHGSYPPSLLAATSAPSPLKYATFSLANVQILDGPYLDPPTTGALLTPSAESGLINVVVSFPAWSSTTVYKTGDFVVYSSVTYQSLVDQNLNYEPDTSTAQWLVVNSSIAIGPNGFTATDIGRHIRLASEPPLWLVGTTYPAGAAVEYNNAYYTALVGSNTGNVPGTDLVHWQLNPTAIAWTWGRITALLNMIAANPSGSGNIGTLTSNGGLTAAFDGVADKAVAACAFNSQTKSLISFNTSTLTDYVGKSFSSGLQIASATLYPSTDAGIGSVGINEYVTDMNFGCTVNLRAKSTLPANSSDGTLLGTETFPTAFIPGPSHGLQTPAFTTPVSIISNDPVTAWKYVWFEIITTWRAPSGQNTNATLQNAVSQMQLFSPAGSSSAGCTVEVLGQALPATTAIRTWRLGLYSGTVGWPTCGVYHGGRVWLAGSVGNRIDGSQANPNLATGLSFAPTEVDGTVTDDSGIDYTFNAEDVNTIFWMKSGPQGISCGTEAGEFLVQATTLNAPITPTSIDARKVTKIGCANIEPRGTEHTVVFVQKFLRKIVEYFSDVFSGKFTAPDLSLPAKHLAERQYMEIAYQQELTPIVWARMGDGSLTGITYKRDSLMTSQGPTFAGHHQHVLGSGRVVESLTLGPSTDGTLDTLTMVTNDPLTSIRHVELLTNIFQETAAPASAWFVDDAIVPLATQNIIMGGQSSCLLSGLWSLVGKKVTAVIGGLDCGDYTVNASGQISVPYGGDPAGLFTQAFSAAATNWVVGFTYTSQGQIVRPMTPQESGARNGPALGKKRKVNAFAALVVNTAGLYFGTSFSKLNIANFRSPGGNPFASNALYSGVYWNTLQDDYSFDGMICWQSTRPYPATIAAIEGFIHTQDK
jgi:hypothetical protein